jgi:hypothetical protein
MTVDRPRDIVEGSGRRGEPRRLDQMISARLDPRLVAALKQFARQHELTLSDVVREAALLLLARQQSQNVTTFNVAVTNERSGITANNSFRQDIPVAI